MARLLRIGISQHLQALELSHKLRHNKGGGMAMSWHIKKGENGDVIWHNGGTGGYRSFAGFVKETGKGVVLLANSSAAADDIGFYLLDPPVFRTFFGLIFQLLDNHNSRCNNLVNSGVPLYICGCLSVKRRRGN